jgi:ribosome-associated protein
VEPKPTYPPDEGETPQYDGPSKSQKKRDSSALQDMGAELVTLSIERLNKIEMPENLRIALRDAKRITQNGAKRRQMQYIGKLMRDVNVTPLKAALDEVKGISTAAKASQQRLERLRAQLMESEDVLGEIARQHPHKEQQLDKPPRAYRELFRLLRELEPQEAAEHE